MKLISYLYQKFNLPSSGRVLFDCPLNQLDPDDLLKLLFFVAAHYAEKSDYLEASFARYGNTLEIHEFLNHGLKIFDHWAQGCYDFLKARQKRGKRYFSNCKQIYLSQVQLKELNQNPKRFHHWYWTILTLKTALFARFVRRTFIKSKIKCGRPEPTFYQTIGFMIISQ